MHISSEDVACIPRHLLDEEICSVLLAADIWNIKHLPAELLSLGDYVRALEGRELLGFQLSEIFGYIPDELHASVREKANYKWHVQPGEFE